MWTIYILATDQFYLLPHISAYSIHRGYDSIYVKSSQYVHEDILNNCINTQADNRFRLV